MSEHRRKPPQPQEADVPRPDAASPVRPPAAARHREAPPDLLPTTDWVTGPEARSSRTAVVPTPGARPRETRAGGAERPSPQGAAAEPRPAPDAAEGAPRPTASV